MPNEILTRAIDSLAARTDLSAEETAEVLAQIMHGEVSEVQIAGFLIALRTKGETVAELAGLARTMRALAAHVPIERDDLLDTAGTGGGRSSFNVSTTAALIAAGAGCAVAKHGNRSATSRSGSADVLEALGARIDLSPQAVAGCIEEAGFGFMFAPAHHQATRFVVPVRRELAGAHEPPQCPRSEGRFIRHDALQRPPTQLTHDRIALRVVPDQPHRLLESPPLAPLPFKVIAP